MEERDKKKVIIIAVVLILLLIGIGIYLISKNTSKRDRIPDDEVSDIDTNKDNQDKENDEDDSVVEDTTMDDGVDTATLDSVEYTFKEETSQDSQTTGGSDKVEDKTEGSTTVVKHDTKVEIATQKFVYDGDKKEISVTLYDEFGNELDGEVIVTYDKEPIKAGTYQATIKYSGSDKYNAYEDTLEFTIEKADLELEVSEVATEYALNNGGNAKEYTVKVFDVDDREITDELNITSSYINASGEVLASVPSEVGEYTYSVLIEESENYKAVEYTKEYEIKAAFVGENGSYATLSDMLWYSEEGETVELQEDITINKIQAIPSGWEYTIDLNGHNITMDNTYFQVLGSTVNLIGTGTISSSYNYGSTFNVFGDTNAASTNYTVLNVGEGVTIEGGCAITINQRGGTGYGIVLNIAGTLKSVTPANGVGLYALNVNGSIKNRENAPIINLTDTAKIISDSFGIYNAGYSNLTIDGAVIEADITGIGFKNGELTLKNNAQVLAHGELVIPTPGNSSGMDAAGAALQIESNTSYGKMKINIENATLTSDNGPAIYEYIGKGDSSNVTEINIKDGSFVGGYEKVVLVSDSLKNTLGSFITGGTYSSDPSEYVNTDVYEVVARSDGYEVVEK